MKPRLELYQFVNRLVYNELPLANLPGSKEPNVLDDDAIKEEDALDFYRFEIAFPECSKSYKQLSLAAQDDLPSDAQPAESDDWFLIDKGVEDEVSEYGSRMPHADTSGASVPISSNDPMDNVNLFADSVVKEGRPDPNFGAWLVPRTLKELCAKVVSQTSLNKIIEQWRHRDLSPSSIGSDSENFSEERADEEKMPTELLYDILATRMCSENQHSAFLQLSGFKRIPSRDNRRSASKDMKNSSKIDVKNSLANDIVFNLFLSCHLVGNYPTEAANRHKTTCTLEKSDAPKYANKNPINICSRLLQYGKLKTPLKLSFNQNLIWQTLNAPDYQSVGGQPSRLPSQFEESETGNKLKVLLQDIHLQISDPEDMLKRFRLAHQLASSLHQLYPGPWIQQEWSVNDLHIMKAPGTRPIEMLHETYLSCVLTKDWRKRIKFPEAAPGYCEKELYSEFFLSFAQLLVELAKGEADDRFSGEIEPQKWFDMLSNELKMGFFKDKLMDFYRGAIEGCLLYLIKYSIEGQQIQEENLRAQSVIHRNIVLPLQRNLSVWEDQSHQNTDTYDGECRDELPKAYGQAQNPLVTPKDGDGSTTSPAPPLGMRDRPTVIPEFILWHSEDDKHDMIEKKPLDPSMSLNSFTTKMGEFLTSYIEKLPEPTSEGKTGQRVRIAIIDTGFHEADDDYELMCFEKQDRIKEKQNFFQPVLRKPNSEHPGLGGLDPNDWKDTHGHGTHVARLLLRYAPRAEIVVAKITNSKSLKTTNVAQLLEALKWAGDHADIINMSFGLGSMPNPELTTEIKRLVTEKSKLIFASASNTGGYGSRSWPATEPGVFCIHVTDEFAKPACSMNPTPLAKVDNFAVLGYQVESYWDGEDRSISGTSFATPIAAAIAANVLEFARRMMPEKAELFTVYGIMRNLFREHMTDNSDGSMYHNIKPWMDDLWSPQNTAEKVCEKLRDVAIYIDKK